MPNKLKKLPRSATALVLAAMLALAPLPATTWSGHYTDWVENNGCEWRGYHRYDEVRDGYARGITWGRGACSEVSVRVWVDGNYTPGYGQTRASASVTGWGLDFNYTDHNADPEGPPPYVGFRHW